MATPSLDSTPSIDVFVTAPSGADDIERVLSALRGQLGPRDRLVILDGKKPAVLLDAAALPGAGNVEHIRGAGDSGFALRSRVSGMVERDIAVVLEDHAIPGPCFIGEVRRRFAADSSVVAFKVLGRNVTSTSPWGWANFFIAFADCLHPADAPPKGMLSTSAAVRRTALRSVPQTLGAWETQVMPGLNVEPAALAYSNDVWVDHVDPCDMKQALLHNFHNQRSIAAMRIAHGQRRVKHTARAFKDLALRRPGQIARALAGRDEYRHFAANRWKVVAICCASALGAIVGAWFGAGSAMRKMH
ncbi:MAG TPA: hypothetical protein VFB68_08295 [Xanthobacteraceae bacterium]|nr:hypothetical protein [Xanthobacteraceae bacterium]